MRNRILLGWSSALLALLGIPALAAEVTMTAESNNELRVQFTAPVQHPDHNFIQLSVLSSTRFGSFSAEAILVEDGMEIASGAVSPDSIAARFVDPTGALSGIPINFASTIGDGVTDGEIIVRIVSSSGVGAGIKFNTDDLSLRTGGDAGTFPGYVPVITAIEVGDAVLVVEVQIDIKPGSDPNSINLCSGGAVPIAILGSELFDVQYVDVDSLRFAEAAVKVVGKKDPNTLCSLDDVNGDGIDDIVCKFETSDIAALDGESSTAEVNGELLDGTPIVGVDSVNIVKDTCS